MLALVLPLACGAAGLDFMKNTPLAYFTDADMQMLRDATKSVLDDPDPRAVREWVNPANKYSGKAEGLGAFKSSDGLRCRKVRISTQAKGIESMATYPMCKTIHDEWQLASGKQLEKE
ncbi:MAG TPA: hypothetical protein VGN07_22775 [Steroidobacteraceae bacterium]|jgi:hypothetical protein